MMNKEIDQKKIIEQTLKIAHQKASQEICNVISFYSNLAVLTTLASTIPNSMEIYERQLKSGVENLKKSPEVLGIDSSVMKMIDINAMIEQQLKSYLDCVNILKEQVKEAIKKNGGK